MMEFNRFKQSAITWDAHYQNPSDICGYEVIRRGQLASMSISKQIAKDHATILEIGCGTGRVVSNLIKSHPGWWGIGLDISPEMVSTCQQMYVDEPRLSFQQHNIEDGTLNIQPDAVLALGVLGYLNAPNETLAFIYSMIKPGGYFIFDITKPSIPSWMTISYRRLRHINNSLYQRFSIQTIRNLLRGKFHVLETYDYCYIPYIPFLRKLVPISHGLEKIFGSSPTALSSTTLIVTQKP